ncbi:inner centromere protein-like [Phalaenopsis equestris]|uniref:inner centromere protein-like n=1 Tax=Phalaenopsis equestris TaxID=78828 RepID=UPI0009E5A061|nr:inner centromere protein-like [Phalaenopsis equestris]
MDSLLKQLRVKFSDENQKDSYTAQEGRIPPFKKERKKATSWYRRSFSSQKDEEDDSADLEFGAAIAAAAYAIMLEEEKGLLGKKKSDELESSLTKTKSWKEDRINRSTDKRKLSRWFSAKEEEEEEEDGRVAGDSFKRKLSALDERMKQKSAANLKEKTMSSTPSVKKTPHTKKLVPPYSSYGFPDGDRTQSTNGLKNANLWEQAKMEKIRKRHEKMNKTILQWENEKKVKAKRRMERKERKLEMRRTRILQEFREEMKRIDMIASGARAVADDTKRKDELMTKEKAIKMQSAMKIRHKCFCF